MPRGLEPEPFHEPIGFSDEVFRRSNRWAWLLVLAVAILGAAVVVALRP